MQRTEGHTIYMGRDKFENEELIRHGFLEDIWCVPLSAPSCCCCSCFDANELAGVTTYMLARDGTQVPRRRPVVCARLPAAADGASPYPGAAAYTTDKMAYDCVAATGKIGAGRHLGGVSGRMRAAREGSLRSLQDEYGRQVLVAHNASRRGGCCSLCRRTRSRARRRRVSTWCVVVRTASPIRSLRCSSSAPFMWSCCQIYTKWRNLKKTQSMEVGQVGFNHPERVRCLLLAGGDIAPGRVSDNSCARTGAQVQGGGEGPRHPEGAEPDKGGEDAGPRRCVASGLWCPLRRRPCVLETLLFGRFLT